MSIVIGMPVFLNPDGNEGAAFGEDEVADFVRLGKGLGHAYRAAILVACAAPGAGLQRPVKLSKQLGLPLSVASYHVRELAELGLLELRAMSTVRGAVAHDYVVADGVAEALDALRRARPGVNAVT